MNTPDDALREAAIKSADVLRQLINSGPYWRNPLIGITINAAEAEREIIEALAASKPEQQDSRCDHHACIYPMCDCEPEQQAQAVEPEVVAHVHLEDVGNVNGPQFVVCDSDEPDAIPVITLQSHREAMAEAERNIAYWQEEARRYAGNADFWREQRDKKNAALKACVDALEAAEDECAKPTSTAVRHAIQQTQEALQ